MPHTTTPIDIRDLRQPDGRALPAHRRPCDGAVDRAAMGRRAAERARDEPDRGAAGDPASPDAGAGAGGLPRAAGGAQGGGVAPRSRRRGGWTPLAPTVAPGINSVMPSVSGRSSSSSCIPTAAGPGAFMQVRQRLAAGASPTPAHPCSACGERPRPTLTDRQGLQRRTGPTTSGHDELAPLCFRAEDPQMKSLNPSAMAAPVAAYSQGVLVPANTNSSTSPAKSACAPIGACPTRSRSRRARLSPTSCACWRARG